MINDSFKSQSGPGHFPAAWRVNTVFSNMPQFSDAFQCPPGSPLNPENRFTVW